MSLPTPPPTLGPGPFSLKVTLMTSHAPVALQCSGRFGVRSHYVRKSLRVTSLPEVDFNYLCDWPTVLGS